MGGVTGVSPGCHRGVTISWNFGGLEHCGRDVNVGLIKDVTDLATQLADRVQDRRFVSDLREIQSMIGEIVSENAGLHERNIELVRENETLRRTIDSIEERIATLESETGSSHVTTSTPVEPLCDEEVQILRFLAQKKEATLSDIAGVFLRDEVTAEHWIDRLVDRGCMLSVSLFVGGHREFRLGRGGRDFLVENGLT